MANKVYEYVTDRIIKQLEQGTIPWRRPWQGGEPINYVTRKPYRGVNRLLLPGGEYLTWNQIHARGGSVKKGATAYMVVFYKSYTRVDEMEDEGETLVNIKPTFVLRYYKVFALGDVTGIESRILPVNNDFEPIAAAEKIVAGYKDGPIIEHSDTGRAFYRPSDDIINIPDPKQFDSDAEYYSTLFHEMIHSTGHRSRLDRFKEQKSAAFGSQDYSKEELVAEIGAAMLCGACHIENRTIENSAAYIKSWLERLRNDKTLIVTAAGKAQTAADYIQGIKG